jgi:NifU-like protein involved in Fe-S cluster formation
MLNDIYNQKILGFAADIARHHRLDHPDGTAVAISKLCGSKVTVDVKLDGDKVSDFGHEVKACALGQASSSIMARHVIGSSIEELRDLRAQMYKMLKEGGPAPTGKWADLAALEPVRDFKARHASTLLTFDAVVAAIDKALEEHKQAGEVKAVPAE